MTRPGPERDALVDTARRLFVADPADDVEELAETDHLVDRKGRVVALRAPRGRRTAMIAAASVLVLYGGLTLGAQAVSAIGVGVAKPPKHADHTAYVGVRLDHTQLIDDVLLTQIRDMGVSVVVDAQAATHRSVELEDLADQGVDIANGGWGKGSFLRWNRARNDVAKAGKVIAREAGTPTREFCPGRRLDAFDQYYSHRQKQKLVVANFTVRPESLPERAAGGEGLRARRSRPRPDGHGGRGGRPPRPVRVGRPPRRAARGTALNPSRTVRLVGAAGLVGAAAVAVVHAAPALGGVSPVGVRFTPALVGVGRKGHVALTFDDGPDPESTPQFLDVLDALGWRATFFMLGEMTRRDPAVARAVAERGHEVGVHGDVHGNMLRRTPRHAGDDIRPRSTAWRTRPGVEPRWFRPPFGISSYASMRAARGLGMTTVLWTTWGRDWRREATPDTVVADVTRRYVDGGTVLLHDSDCTSYPGSWRSALGALPRLADEFAARGLTVGTVGEHGIERPGTRA